MSEVAERRRGAFKTWVKEHGGAAEVARKAGMPPTTLYSYLAAKSDSLKGTTQEKVAEAFGVPVGDLFTSSTVPLVGYVGAGAAAHYYASADDGLGEVPAPQNATPETVAVEIRGTSLGPLFESWLIYYDEVRRPVSADLHGRLCVVGLPDGRILVKRIRASRSAGYFHLESNNEPTMPDEMVEWAARVKLMTPR